MQWTKTHLTRIVNGKFTPQIALVLFFTFISLLNRGIKNEGVLGDFGREVYIPQAMQHGAVLYKDVINIFTPLSYQINYLATLAFGNSLYTYFALGLLGGIICILFLYKIALLFVSKQEAFISVLGIISSLFVAFNAYTMPYSYGAVYATAGLLVSIFYFIKPEKNITLTFIAAGFSIANKYEYTLYIVLLFIYVLFKHKNQIFRAILAFSGFPILSFLLLLASGWTFESLPETLNFMAKYISSPSLATLYSRLSTYIPYPIILLYSFATLVVTGLAGFLAISITQVIMKSAKELSYKNTLALFGLGIFFIVSVFGTIVFHSGIFSFVPLALLIIFLFRNRFKTLPALNLITVVAIVTAFKGLIVTAITYSPYILALPLLAFFIHLHINLPRYIHTKNASNIAILAMTVPLFFFWQYDTRYYNCLIETEKGNLYVNDASCEKVKGLLTELLKNAPIQVNVVPDGLIYNYLTNIPADNITAFMFMPPYLEAYGEEKLIEKLESRHNYDIYLHETPVYYVYINPDNKESGYFGRGYGTKVFNYIENNYRIINKVDKQYTYYKK